MENPTSEEKVLAALAHGSVMLMFFGPLGAVIIWAIQRTKSKYVRYHALQAMGYQTFSFWVWMVVIFLFMLLFFGVIILLTAITSDSPSSTPPDAIFFIQPLFMLFIFGLWGLLFLFGFIAAVFCMMGKDFRYPLIGSWLQKNVINALSEEEAEKWEDAWVAGVCHATAILQLWGMIMPIIVWFSQKDRSARLKFQSMQAFVYQVIVMAAYIISYIGFFAVYIAMIAILAASGFVSDPSQTAVSPVFEIIFIVIMALFMLFWLAWMILYPAYLIMAAVATVRTLRGHDFKYPLLGRLINKWMPDPSPQEVLKA
jgi:uncharacterized Tic20 family protein